VAFDRDKTFRMDGGGVAIDAASTVEGLLRLFTLNSTLPFIDPAGMMP
jgi:hypothetical protein